MKTKKTLNIFMISALLALVIFTSCRKDETISSDPSYKLSFSTDSVLFDTVFTTMGSVTKRLMVYNPNENSVVISRVKLAGGSNSPYNINIDGASGTSVSNIEIGGNDSIYVFVRVTVDPVNDNLPLVVKDSVIFETNGNVQDVDLVAWGQDAHFIVADQHLNGLPPFSYIAKEGENIHWTNDKPYVIVGYGVVDSAASLTIDAGCKIHFYNNAGMWIYRYGAIQVNGSLEEPVMFQGLRLEQEYQDVPAQWDRIWINESDVNSEFNYAIIKNGTIGIQAETLRTGLGNTLVLNNTQILNMQGWGIFTRFYQIEGNNVIVANAGSSLLNLTTGGSYQFKNSTFANYWGYDVRKDPLLHISDYFILQNGNEQLVYTGDLENAYFGDCIFYGSLENEILLDKYPESTSLFNYNFDYSLLKTPNTNDEYFTNCIFNKDPIFVNSNVNDYHIDSLSPVKALGIPMGNTIDLDGIERGETPDLGAYQWVPVADEKLW
ncbi:MULTISPECIES: hypothetical protein [unclassified Lentimicrobium]|uniref:hypothetical protein n=1 Tax=unclassified Lentimicrobium TaxID=2677434 RepID=UPI001556B6B0|nr:MULTISPECIES: hypothetical protein [unclassified Lentimicrobium]NPD45655.1 hypothetical protein [Lentimicrobium sp. S6]NPD86410.1 hypothetical protein [Lentimicrobium sp. L6]